MGFPFKSKGVIKPPKKREWGQKEAPQKPLRLLTSQNGYKLTPLSFVESHFPLQDRKQGMVSAHADTLARIKLRPSLAHNDRARLNKFTPKFLDA